MKENQPPRFCKCEKKKKKIMAKLRSSEKSTYTSKKSGDKHISPIKAKRGSGKKTSDGDLSTSKISQTSKAAISKPKRSSSVIKVIKVSSRRTAAKQ